MVKKLTLFSLSFFIVALIACSSYMQATSISHCEEHNSVNNYSKATELKKIIDDFTKNGVPGCALTVYSDEGWWEYAAGYAKIEDKTPMQACNLQYLQSVSKTYMAVAILKLHEEGKIDLDASMRKYLPARYQQYLPATDSVTIRMMLNHTSGLPEYNFQPQYVSYLLQHPNYHFTIDELLKPIRGKKLQFRPGSKHVYTNTNYMLLALIADSLTGDHAKFISENVFKPLQLTNTFYRNDSAYLKYLTLPNSYWDRYSNSILENVSEMQRTNVSTLVGDDGIVSTPADAVKFLKGLMEGKLLSSSSLTEMEQWVNDKKGNPIYGLGLVHPIFNGQEGMGHSGGGIGAGCELYYFPKKNLYFFLAINIGTVTESPLHEKLMKIKDELWTALLQ